MTDLIETGVVVEPVTTEEANERAALIRQGMANYAETLALVGEAYNLRDWEVLGYATWSAYVETEFSEARVRLPGELRQQAIEALRFNGLSSRAIGDVLGVSHQTVQRSLPTGPNGPVAPIVGVNGKSYAPTAPPKTTDAPSVGVGTLSPPAAPNDDDAPARGVEDARIDEAGGEDDLPPLAPEPPASDPEPVLVDADGARWVWHEGEYFHGPGTRRPGYGFTREQLETELGPMTIGLAETPVDDRNRWTPDQRRDHEVNVKRSQDIDAARLQAKTIVTDFRGLVYTIVRGCRLGEIGLVTAEVIGDLRKTLNALESEL